MRGRRGRFSRLAAAALAVLAINVGPSSWGVVARAEPPEQAPTLQVTNADGGVDIEWQGQVQTGGDGLPSVADWPLVDIGSLHLPAQLVPLLVQGEQPIAPQVENLAARTWTGRIGLATSPETATTAAEDGRPGLSAVASIQALPVSPVVVLREGRLRGNRIAVLSVSPLFAQAGEALAATALHIRVPGATLLATDAENLLTGSGPFLPLATPPANPLAATDALKVLVSRAGIQRITGRMLQDAGWDLAGLDPTLVSLYYNGVEVPLDATEVTGNRLGLDTALRFYAPEPGDRWNATDTYWLTVGMLPGARMASRAVTPGTAPLSPAVRQDNAWHHNTYYDALLPGPSGDHWFSVALSSLPGDAAATFTVPLTSTLAPISTTMVLTITGSAHTAGPHRLVATLGGYSQTLSWGGTGDWTHTLSYPVSGEELVLALQSGAIEDAVMISEVAWTRSVTPDAGGRGVTFTNVPGVWRYRVTNVPSGATLYDVSDPGSPTILTMPGSDVLEFQDGLQGRQYLVAGPGTLQLPVVERHSPVSLVLPLNADVLYIGPKVFHAELAPLVALRTGQGHAVAVVDVQDIYDAWSFGQVSPEAIRSFLRYAAATWLRAPIAVTLVGDGTSDPLNYTGRNNLDFLPPYLAMVDPWAGETACETCYAQLDGANPLDDELPDLMLGRLPVKSPAELRSLVAKLTGYEAAPARQDWQRRAVFIADNGRQADGSLDPGGDFAAFADAAIAHQPMGLDIRRMYYAPSSATSAEPWRVSDAQAAHQQTLDLLQAGAGLVTYVGHSHQWQWAVTDVNAMPPYLLGLYDVDGLTNGDRLPVILDMSCLTAAFQTPAFSGTTIDERLLLQDGGGAVAVWGASGLGSASGHDLLLEGFYDGLWRAESGTAPLGALTSAGYWRVFTAGSCCQSSLRTHLLLGDPLTPARVYPRNLVYLPLLQR